MRRATMRADVPLLVALQGCMKQPVVGRAGGIARSKACFRPSKLSGREPEIKRMLNEGRSITSMAEKLGVARKTLRKHMEMKGLGTAFTQKKEIR